MTRHGSLPASHPSQHERWVAEATLQTRANGVNVRLVDQRFARLNQGRVAHGDTPPYPLYAAQMRRNLMLGAADREHQQYTAIRPQQFNLVRFIP